MSKYTTPVKFTVDIAKLRKQISAYEKNADKAINATLSDFRKRAPGWVATEAMKHFAIKKADLLGKKTSVSQKPAVKIYLKEKKGHVTLEYIGRRLTPLHFGMTPKASPKSGRRYRVKAEIVKGHQKTYSNRVFLKNVKKNEPDEKEIPFQRRSDGLHPILTVSVPQILDNNLVRKDLLDAMIGEKMQERLDHNVERFLGK